MEEAAGWTLDPGTLKPTVLDRALLQSQLDRADPADRVLLLGLLGRFDEGFAEAEQVLAEPAVDPWQVLLLVGDLHRWRGDLAACDRYQVQAWRHALTRTRQATTLQHVGLRWHDAGDLDRAAQHFELALTMRRGFTDPGTLAGSEQLLAQVRGRLGYDALVLAGGRGVRLGGRQLGAKALIRLAGWPLADHVLLAVAGATSRIQVGPRRVAIGSPRLCAEQPPGGGPVAAIAAGLPHIRQPLVAVLAGDLPFIAGALAELRRPVATGAADAALLVDLSGRANYLAAVWRTEALREALVALGDPVGAPVRALYRRVEVATVPDFDGCSADVDTPADLRTAADRISSRNPGGLPATPLAWPRLELHAPS